MDPNTLFSTLNSLKLDTSWNYDKLVAVISEIAVISKNPTVDTILPVVLTIIDKAKTDALSKLPEGVSSGDVSLLFDDLKVVAKYLVPVLVQNNSSFWKNYFCCSSESSLKVIDQTAIQKPVEKPVEEKIVEEKIVEKPVKNDTNQYAMTQIAEKLVQSVKKH